MILNICNQTSRNTANAAGGRGGGQHIEPRTRQGYHTHLKAHNVPIPLHFTSRRVEVSGQEVHWPRSPVPPSWIYMVT